MAETIRRRHSEMSTPQSRLRRVRLERRKSEVQRNACPLSFESSRVESTRCAALSSHAIARCSWMRFSRSVRQHASVAYTSLCVLYTTTSDRHRESYATLEEIYREVEWVEESSFRDDLNSLVGRQPVEPLTVFHTDDDIFFRTFLPPELRDDEVCFSLRLGVNTVYSYPFDASEEATGVSAEDGRLRWAWREQEPGSFAYPLSLNGHVFRTPEVQRWLHETSFENPNELEAALQAVDDGLPPMMASYEHSVVVSLPLNVVNDVYFNRAEWTFGPEELNERFALGQRFDLEQMDFSRVVSAHEQIAPVLSGEDAALSPIFSAWARERTSWVERAQALARRLDESETAKEWLSEQREAWEREARRCGVLRPCKRRSPNDAKQSRAYKRR